MLPSEFLPLLPISKELGKGIALALLYEKEMHALMIMQRGLRIRIRIISASWNRIRIIVKSWMRISNRIKVI
jgi:hypothetical protein